MTAADSDPSEPNLLLIGAAKCATTSMWSYLDAHPDIFMSEPKEPGYFDGTHDLAKEAAWYFGLFSEGRDHLVRGEASTTYTRHPTFPGVARRIHDRLPSARLIYLIRDPMVRIRSHFLMRLRSGLTEGDFEDVLRTKSEYVEISSYGSQVTDYLRYFHREQILILRAEDLLAQPDETMRTVFEFLRVGRPIEDLGPRPILNSRPAGTPQRPIRTPRPLRAVSQFVRLPDRPKRFLKRHLTRRAPDAELTLSASFEAELIGHFRRDFAQLRRVVGPDLDLYGLA